MYSNNAKDILMLVNIIYIIAVIYKLGRYNML